MIISELQELDEDDVGACVKEYEKAMPISSK